MSNTSNWTNDHLFNERLSDRALKSRWNILLFSAITFIYMYSEASISQLFFLKFESAKEVPPEFWGLCLYGVLLFHFVSFVYLAVEEFKKHNLSIRLKEIESMKSPLSSISSNIGRLTNINLDAFNRFNEQFGVVTELASNTYKNGLIRYWILDISPPVIAFVIASLSVI